MADPKPAGRRERGARTRHHQQTHLAADGKRTDVTARGLAAVPPLVHVHRTVRIRRPGARPAHLGGVDASRRADAGGGVGQVALLHVTVEYSAGTARLTTDYEARLLGVVLS